MIVYLVVGLIAIDAILIACGAYFLSSFMRGMAEGTEKIRAQHVRELQQEKQLAHIQRHEMGLDSAALQLACMDLMNAADPKTGLPYYLGITTWKDARTMLRRTAIESQKVRIKVARSEDSE